VLKASVRGVKGVVVAFPAPAIMGGPLRMRVARRDLVSCKSSDSSFCVARSSFEGIMDQMPSRRLRRKMNL
jgi:hypothetical protein